MDRRAFISRTVLGLLGAPLVAEAQRAGKVWRIGVLGNENSAPWEGLRQGLRDLGYVDGRNVTIEWRWSEGRTDRLPALAIELVQLKVDVIVASGTQGVRAAKQATSTIPIVMTVSSYPDKIGLVESLARPGGNITGLSNIFPGLAGKRLELLKEALPSASRVAVLWEETSPVKQLRAIESFARATGVQLNVLTVHGPDDFDTALGAAKTAKAEGVVILGSVIHTTRSQRLAELAAKHRLPAIYYHRRFAEAGGLLAYGPKESDPSWGWRRARRPPRGATNCV